MKKICSFFLILTIVVFLCSCNKEEQKTMQNFYFDTLISITVGEKDLPAANKAFDICAELENTFSRTKKGSELYKINEEGFSSLSPHMQEVLEFSLDFSKECDGAFDITVAPLTDLWNIKERTVPPSDEEIALALRTVGYQSITLSPFQKGDVGIDLGAVAKGYAADIIREKLVKEGVDKAIIDLGGNVQLIGEYTVGIRNPFNPEEIYAKFTLKDKSAVTSGAYQRYFTSNGVRYHHILDPRTGKCADSGIASVTVISESSMQADALSTAIFVIGKDGLKLCDKYPLTDALLIMEDGEIITTEGFGEKYSLTVFEKN